MSFPCGLAGKESTCNAGDLGSVPGLGRSPGEGKGYPLQDSVLENSMECIVHGVARSRTRLSDFHFQISLVSKYLCLQNDAYELTMLDLSFRFRDLHDLVPTTLLMEFFTNRGLCLQTAQFVPNLGCLYLLFLFPEIPSSEKMHIIWPPYFVQVCSNSISSKIFPNTPKQRNTPSPSISYHPFSPLFFIAFIGM